MKTFWIRFRQNFTDLSEGRTLAEAVGRLGMTIDDVIEWEILY
jgi:hypothetical protein